MIRSTIKTAKTRSFPGADVGSDHDLLIMTIKIKLKSTKKPRNSRIKYNLEKLRDPNVLKIFQGTIGGNLRHYSYWRTHKKLQIS